MDWDFGNIPEDQMSAGLQKHSERLVNNLMDAEGRTEFTSLTSFLFVQLLKFFNQVDILKHTQQTFPFSYYSGQSFI